jgi:hypothetical protein
VSRPTGHGAAWLTPVEAVVEGAAQGQGRNVGEVQGQFPRLHSAYAEGPDPRCIDDESVGERERYQTGGRSGVPTLALPSGGLRHPPLCGGQGLDPAR